MKRVSFFEYERERLEIEALSSEIVKAEEGVASLRTLEEDARADYVRARAATDEARRRIGEARDLLASERGRYTAYHRWAEFYRGLKNWRRVGLYRRLISETSERISHLERSLAWWTGRIRSLEAEASRIAGLVDRRLRERLAAERDLSRRRGELERLKREFEEKVVVPPVRVWEYGLRVSARVLRGYAPGRARRAAAFPPRWVDLTIELSVELAALPEGERRKRIIEILKEGYPKTKRKVEEFGLKSPIFVELFFESFLSSIEDERELEGAYRDKFIKLVEDRKGEVAKYMNMLEVELGEWDFGIESKKGLGAEEADKVLGEGKSSDFYEIWNYLPSGFSQLVWEAYWEHPVGEGEKG